MPSSGEPQVPFSLVKPLTDPRRKQQSCSSAWSPCLSHSPCPPQTVMSCHVTPRHTTPCHATPRHVHTIAHHSLLVCHRHQLPCHHIMSCTTPHVTPHMECGLARCACSVSAQSLCPEGSSGVDSLCAVQKHSCGLRDDERLRIAAPSADSVTGVGARVFGPSQLPPAHLSRSGSLKLVSPVSRLPAVSRTDTA